MVRAGNLEKYIQRHYPHREELSKARLTWMLYLADWKSVITNGVQITDIVWGLSDQGPYAKEGWRRSRRESGLRRGLHRSHSPLRASTSFSITKEEAEILDFVIESCASKSWLEFKRLIYSTYPVMTQRKAEKLDLPKLAESYRDKRELLVGS